MYLGENKWKLYENKMGCLKFPVMFLLWLIVIMLKITKGNK